MIVVDASVVVRHLTAADERPLLDLVRSERLAAPELLIAEICNALATMERHVQIPGHLALSMVSQLHDLIDHLFPMEPLAGRAFELAAELRHPAYDCFYLALAEAERTVLVTADRRLLSRLAGTRYQSLARSI